MLPFAILVITMELLLGNAGLSFPPAIAIPRSSSKFTCNDIPHYTADLVEPWVFTVTYFVENENQFSKITFIEGQSINVQSLSLKVCFSDLIF